MKCTSCVTGDMAPGTTTVTVQRGRIKAVIRDVPASLCNTRDNNYVNEATMRRLESLVNDAAATGAIMVVHDFGVACQGERPDTSNLGLFSATRYSRVRSDPGKGLTAPCSRADYCSDTGGQCQAFSLHLLVRSGTRREGPSCRQKHVDARVGIGSVPAPAVPGQAPRDGSDHDEADRRRGPQRTARQPGAVQVAGGSATSRIPGLRVQGSPPATLPCLRVRDAARIGHRSDRGQDRRRPQIQRNDARRQCDDRPVPGGG